MRQRWNNLPLRNQLALALMSIMLVLSLIFGIVIYISVRIFLVNQTASQLREQAEYAIDLFTPNNHAPGELSERRMQELTDALSSRTTSAVVYSAEGRVLSTGAAAPLIVGNGRRITVDSPDPPRFRKTPRSNPNQYVALTTDGLQVVVLVPIDDTSAASPRTLQLATSFQPIATVLNRVMRLLVFGIMLMSLAAFVLAKRATKAVIRPLERVVNVSHAVAAGNLQARTALQSPNEVGQLGAAFDNMVEQVQTSFATQRRFVADAAHELRTPLTTLSGSVELMMMGAVSDPNRQRTTLQRMLNEIERMTRLVNDLLTLSRLDARPELRLGPVELDVITRDMLHQVQVLDQEHQFTITTQPVTVHVDPDRLRQVLVNLLDNARKYTPTNGTIAVTVESTADAAQLVVRDTGVGIPASDVAHIWDRFYRVDQARARATGGVGLGLAIVKSIVDAHHGTVHLESQEGQGTTVTVALPLVLS